MGGLTNCQGRRCLETHSHPGHHHRHYDHHYCHLDHDLDGNFIDNECHDGYYGDDYYKEKKHGFINMFMFPATLVI